jgi:hypothetical protein
MRRDATNKEDRSQHVERLQDRHVSSIASAVYSCSVPDEGRGQAEVLIPSAWLLPNLSLDAVRALQRGDTTSDIEKGDLRLAGIEVLVARNWVKEEFWPRIQDAVQKGYAAEKTYTFMRAHGDRRGSRRPKK